MANRNFVKVLLLSTLLILGLQNSAQAKGSGTVVSDSAITALVKAKLVADQIVSASDVHVETNKGIVSLRGDVKSQTEADRAVELAFSVSGVSDVSVSHLMIQNSKRPLKDALITAKIKGLYVREKVFGDKSISVSGIHVETKDGIAYLSGKVDNDVQIKNAKQLARTIKGVTDVKSTISVNGKY
jgi:hyperosmotically inducible protein